MTNAQHSAATDQHGTNPDIIALATATLGFIDVDPASSPEWNELVGASRIITREQNGLRTSWFKGAPSPIDLLVDETEWHPGLGRGTVFLNPPGDKRGDKVRRFWNALAEYYRRGFVTAAVYEGFSLEQLSRLQRVGTTSHPLEHTTLIPEERQPHRDTPTTLGMDPTHACFVTLLSDDIRQIETFTLLGSKLGHVIQCGRPRR